MQGQVRLEKQTGWHHQEYVSVCGEFEVRPERGLDPDAVARQRQRFGLNQIPEARRRSPFTIFVSQFSDLMVIILIMAAVISGLIGEMADTITIVIILLLNAIIGFIQEVRAEQAMSALRELAAPGAVVRRAGEVSNISAKELVPGDIILLDAGSAVPADARLIEVATLRTDESTLTGESSTVDKITQAIPEQHTVIGDRINMVFKGTQVTHGRAVAIVTDTGLNTELGKIATLLEKEELAQTPLQERLKILGRQLAFLVLFICIALFVVGLLRGEEMLLMFLTAVSLAVAAIPEALPAVVNIALAVGARQMSAQHALVRRLPAVESLGSVTYICTDKTGTLTMNKMQASQVFFHDQWHDTAHSTAIPSDLRDAMRLCNDAQMTEDGLRGDPTETAILSFVSTVSSVNGGQDSASDRFAELPFDSDRKSMTTFHPATSGYVAFTKGSPERILAITAFDATGASMSDTQRALYTEQAMQVAANGHRVLGFAARSWDTLPQKLEIDEVESQLQFLGFIALIDPPRPEAKQAVELCKTAGIVPVMITGDHALTAAAIATELGICDSDEAVMTGEQLHHMSDTALADVVLHKRVYARVSPEQKIRIVEALQRKGQFVAMTGDGVNDAPALRFAHVGIAMGDKGTDVAREASDVILLDDNFATIVYAVSAGRRIYDNIRKFIRYTMTSNAGEVWTLLLAPLMGLPVPLLPIHILWINLVTDGLPGLALSFEKAEPKLMQRPPRPPGESVFANGMWQHILVIGLLIGFLSLGVQAWAMTHQLQWQTMVFTVLTFSQLAHVMAIRSEEVSLFQFGLTSNPKLLWAVLFTVILQLGIIYLPFMNDIFKTQPLSIEELLVCIGLSSTVFVAVEVEKWLVRTGRIYQRAA